MDPGLDDNISVHGTHRPKKLKHWARMGIYDQSGLGKLWILYWCWPAFHASSAVLEEPGLALTKRAHLIFLWQSMHGQKLRYNYVSVWYQFIFIIYQKLKQKILKNSLFKKKKKKKICLYFD